jgi:putative hemolysin
MTKQSVSTMLSTTVSPAGSVSPHHRAAVSPTGGIVVSWARHEDEVREAQRLRYEVLASATRARLDTRLPGHDVDLFDDFCEHLLVRASQSGDVIGTFRVLTPSQALRVGSTHLDTEFDLTRLRGMRDRFVELGRSCVHPDHRNGRVIVAKWRALADFMRLNSFDTVVGCASMPMLHDGRVCGHAAASIWNRLGPDCLAPIEYQVRPRLPLPIEELNGTLLVETPDVMKAYLRLGAKVLGPPAWNPHFNSAEFPMLLRLAEVPDRRRTRLLLG